MRHFNLPILLFVAVALAIGSACNPFDDTAAKREFLQRFLGDWDNNILFTWAERDDVTVTYAHTTVEATEAGGVGFEFGLVYDFNRIFTGNDYISIPESSDCTVTLEYLPGKGGYFLSVESDEWLKIEGLVLDLVELGGLSGEADVDNGDVRKIRVNIKSGETEGYVWTFTGLDSAGEELLKCTHTMVTAKPEEESEEPAEPADEES